MTSHAVTSTTALAGVLSRIEKARAGAIRPAPSTTLIAVSKTHAADAIRPVIEAGQRVFGESRVQEARNKWPALRQEFSDIELHLIGPLQTNKVRDAIELFDAIHTLDRPKLALALKGELARSGRTPILFVQVNTGEEPQKGGVLPREACGLIRHCREDLGLPVKGLMCIPPVDQPPAMHFALLQKLAREHQLPHLSMGMSDDYESAIKFGATHIRVGTAIFGSRKEENGPATGEATEN